MGQMGQMRWVGFVDEMDIVDGEIVDRGKKRGYPSVRLCLPPPLNSAEALLATNSNLLV